MFYYREDHPIRPGQAIEAYRGRVRFGTIIVGSEGLYWNLAAASEGPRLITGNVSMKEKREGGVEATVKQAKAELGEAFKVWCERIGVTPGHIASPIIKADADEILQVALEHKTSTGVQEFWRAHSGRLEHYLGEVDFAEIHSRVKIHYLACKAEEAAKEIEGE